ncbi:DUF3761 domain-containing protein [Aeromicrobium massiliense]|uniref:DUF3761 domain-containing protein n=1 Tax=Aeromicrobium massiliense TaxID=1464554 RepID=UPI0009DA6A46
MACGRLVRARRRARPARTPRSSPVPLASQPPVPRAICADGTVSHSRNDSGTCSWNGGVAGWASPEPPPDPAPSQNADVPWP